MNLERAVESPVSSRPTALLPSETNPRKLIGARIALNIGESFDRSEKDFDLVYQLCRGAGRVCTAPAAGGKEILDFLVPGDFFIQVPGAMPYGFEAIVDRTIVMAYSLQTITCLAKAIPGYAEIFNIVMTTPADRLHRQISILSGTSPTEKLALFLRDMFERLSPYTNNDLMLPMCRPEIAKYLSMTDELTHQALQPFAKMGAIREIGTRGVMITNGNQLYDLQ
jgi:CRP/FNR family nitrogen fixation transcriptional regulator